MNPSENANHYYQAYQCYYDHLKSTLISVHDPSNLQQYLQIHHFLQVVKLNNHLLDLDWNALSNQITANEHLQKQIKKTVCSASISQKQLSFKCLDCGNENEFHILCEECYNAGDHYQHRVLFFNDRGGCCDCGDQDAINESGFCKLHSGLMNVDKQQIELYILKQEEDLTRLILWSFFVFIFETICNHSKNKSNNQESSKKHQLQVELLFQVFIDHITQKIDKNICQIFMISRIFITNFNQYWILHEYDNYDFSMLEVLIMISSKLSQKTQDKFEQMIYGLFPNIEFKNQLALSYSKTFSYMINIQLYYKDQEEIAQQQQQQEQQEQPQQQQQQQQNNDPLNELDSSDDMSLDESNNQQPNQQIHLSPQIIQFYEQACQQSQPSYLNLQSISSQQKLVELILKQTSIHQMLSMQLQYLISQQYINTSAQDRVVLLELFEEKRKKLIEIQQKQIQAIKDRIAQLNNQKLHAKISTSQFKGFFTQFFSEEHQDLYTKNSDFDKTLYNILNKLMMILVSTEIVSDEYNVYETIRAYLNIFQFLIQRNNSILGKIRESDFIIMFTKAISRNTDFKKEKDIHIGRYIAHMNQMIVDIHAQLLNLVEKESQIVECLDILLDEINNNIDDYKVDNIVLVNSNILSFKLSVSVVCCLLVKKGYHYVFDLLQQKYKQKYDKVFMKMFAISLRNLVETPKFVKKYAGSYELEQQIKHQFYINYYSVFNGFQVYFDLLIVQVLQNILDLRTLDELYQDIQVSMTDILQIVVTSLTNESGLISISQRYLEEQKIEWIDETINFMVSQLYHLEKGSQSMKYPALIDKISKLLFKHKFERLDQNIVQISNLEQNQLELQLNQQYSKANDPYCFKAIDNTKYYQNFIEIYKLRKWDLILGNRKLQQQSFLNQVRQNYQSVNFNYLLISNMEIIGKVMESENEFKKVELSGYFKDMLKFMSIYIDLQNTDTEVLDNPVWKHLFKKLLEYSQLDYKEVINHLELLMKQNQKIEQKCQEQIDDPSKSQKVSLAKQRQMKMLAQFSKKQNNFQQKNEDELQQQQQNNQENEQEDINCVVCYESINMNEKLDDCIGLICYIQRDNLSSYYFYDRQNNQNQKDSEFGFSMYSCGHTIHKKCCQVIQQKKNQNSQMYQDYLEYLCPLCKSFSNTLIPIISQYFYEKQPLVFQQQSQYVQQDHQQYQDIKEYLQMNFMNITDISGHLNVEEHRKKMIFEDIQLFQSQLIMLQFIAQGQQQNNDNLVIQIQFDLLFYYSDLLFRYGLNQNYLKKNRMIVTNIWRNLQISYSEFTSLTIDQYKQSILKELLELWQEFNAVESIKQLENLDLRISKIIWIVSVVFTNDSMILIKMVRHILQQLVKVFLMQMINKNNEMVDNLSLFAYLKPYLEVIVGILSVIFQLNEQDLNELTIEDNQQIERQIEIFNRIIPINSIISQFQFNSQTMNNESEQQQQININKNYKFKFQLIDIGQNYLETARMFSYKLCSVCNDFPRKEEQDLVLCMICGEIMCNKICKSPRFYQQNKCGNLAYHSLAKHAGQSYFFMLSSSNTLFIDSPKLTIHQILHYNRLGQLYNSNKLKWDQYRMNQKTIEMVRDLLVERKLTQYINYKYLRSEPGQQDQVLFSLLV